MHPFRHLTLFFLILIAALILVGCSSTGAALQPTPDQQIVEQTVEVIRTQAAETVIAELTASAPLSTETPLPSPTPLPPTEEPTQLPPTLTATAVPVFPTATFIPLPTQTNTPSAYSCTIVSQSPVSGASLKVKEDFDFVVKVKNNGTNDWDMHVVDFSYASGTKFQTYVDVIDFPEHVKSGSETTLIIDMRAPDTAGSYTASWTIGEGSSKYCTATINIKVTE